MVDEDKLKIIDFDISLRVPFTDPVNEGCVTDVSEGTTRRLIVGQGQGGTGWKYMAPEVVSRKAFDGPAVDLWSAGIILFTMLLGVFPFNSAQRVDELFFKYAVKGELENSIKEMGSPISDLACDLLQSMLWEDPRKRLTLLQIMEHPWVTNDTNMNVIVNASSEQMEERAHIQKSIWYRALTINSVLRRR